VFQGAGAGVLNTMRNMAKVWIFERLKEEAAKPTYVSPFFGYYLEREESGSAEDILKRMSALLHSGIRVPEPESKKRR